MTNEEAIKILTIDGAYLYPDRCYNYEAFELAIKALKNERDFEKDVIHSIAKQYSEHNELVPSWLHIGNVREVDNETDN